MTDLQIAKKEKATHKHFRLNEYYRKCRFPETPGIYKMTITDGIASEWERTHLSYFPESAEML